MSFSIAFIKDKLKEIVDTLATQGKEIDEIKATNEGWMALLREIKQSLQEKGTTLPDHMAAMRAAKAAKTEEKHVKEN